MPELDFLANRQAVWSKTAKKCKALVDRARKAAFALSVIGAALAATSTQFEAARNVLTISGSICLAAAAFLTARFLNRECIARHTKARAASEALKREAFLFATSSGDYAEPDTSGSRLSEAQTAIEDEIDDLTRFEVGNAGQGSCPRGPLDKDGYLEKRLRKQITFYRRNADDYATRSGRLRALEIVLAFLAAIITAASNHLEGIGMSFDLAAFAAVLTTLAGTILAHVNASHYDELTSAYRATARRLERLEAEQERYSLQELVAATEAAIQNENQSWFALWSKET